MPQQKAPSIVAAEFKKPKDAVFVVRYELGEDGKGRLRLEGLVDKDEPGNSDETVVSDYYLKKYFVLGTRYKLFQAGAAAGSAEITDVAEATCITKSGVAKAETTVRLDLENYALATNGAQVTTHLRTRREPNEQEKAAAVARVRRFLQARGIPAADLRKVEVKHLVSTTLGKTEARFLLGSFQLQTDTHVHKLFVIFALGGDGARIELGNYSSNTKLQEDEQPGVEELVDQLDIDGDGVDEIVTISPGAEAYSYPVYQRRGNRWVRVTRGVGGGC
ncbi:MAG TPA: hypothetical protein VF532_04955 [Candidatus Angelobacter sp.]